MTSRGSSAGRVAGSERVPVEMGSLVNDLEHEIRSEISTMYNEICIYFITILGYCPLRPVVII